MSVSPYITPGIHITPEIIIQQVCNAYGIDRGFIFIFCRKRKLVEPRMMICLLLRRLSGMTLKQIAATIRRDHTTVIFSIKRIISIAMTDPETMCKLKTVCFNLGAGEGLIKQWIKEHTT